MTLFKTMLRRGAITALLLCLAVPLAMAAGQTEGTATAAAKQEVTATGDLIPVTTPEAPMATYQQAPELDDLVASGQLKAVRERLPDLPPVIQPVEEIGKYGGTLRHTEFSYTNFGSITRYMHEGLFALTVPGASMYPNLAESLNVSDDLMEFTVKLRKGVKWSDGHELTTEDIIFHWEDVVRYSPDPEVEPDNLVSAYLVVGGKPIELEAVDDYTLVIRTATPYADIQRILTHYQVDTLPSPAHYLKQFHPKYIESEKDAVDLWQEFSTVHASMTNPERPTLGPWMADTVKEGDFMTLKRNPYYWKVDAEGRQLPYADGLRITYLKDSEVQILQLASGSFDWSGMSVPQSPVLFQNQEKGNYRMIPHQLTRYIALRINNAWASMEHEDPQEQKLAKLLQDVRFIKALQLGINNEHVTTAFAGPEVYEFAGGIVGHPHIDAQGVEGKMTDDPRVAALWEFLEEWLSYDPEEANAILDDLGLAIGSDGYRHHPDGDRLEINVGTWSDWQPEGEIGQMLALQLEQELKIKFYVETRTWSQGVGDWYVNGLIPLLMVGVASEFWAANTIDLQRMFQYPMSNWLIFEGEKGTEPFDRIKEPLLELKEIADEAHSTPDKAKKIDLAIQAAEILIYNHIDHPLLVGYRGETLYGNNRVVNLPPDGGYPPFGARRLVRMEQWWIRE